MVGHWRELVGAVPSVSCTHVGYTTGEYMGTSYHVFTSGITSILSAGKARLTMGISTMLANKHSLMHYLRDFIIKALLV